MPMIEGRYDSSLLTHRQAKQVFGKLTESLRIVMRQIRPNQVEYGVTVEGDPFGSIAFQQPDLRIYVFYHKEWNFNSQELQALADGLLEEVKRFLEELRIKNLKVQIRFYERAGHAGANNL